jgi:hypothetical protein
MKFSLESAAADGDSSKKSTVSMSVPNKSFMQQAEKGPKATDESWLGSSCPNETPFFDDDIVSSTAAPVRACLRRSHAPLPHSENGDERAQTLS